MKKLVTVGLSVLTLGASLASTVTTQEWKAKTPDQIKIQEGATEYEFQWGDTIWAIGQAINVKTETLLEINDLTEETAKAIPVGRIIKLVKGEGDKVSMKVTDANDTVVGTRELTQEDKVNKELPFGVDVTTGKETLKITKEKDGSTSAVPTSSPIHRITNGTSNA